MCADGEVWHARAVMRVCYVFALLLPFLDASHHGGYDHGGYTHSPRESECNSDSLTCVPSEACHNVCPPGFVGLGGGCYLFWNVTRNSNRTWAEAKDYCRQLGSTLIWFENSNEWNEIVKYLKNGSTTLYHTDATYSRYRGSWVWDGNDASIHWKILLKDTEGEAFNLNVVEIADLRECLPLNATVTPPGRAQVNLASARCLSDNGFICKLGKFGSRCSRTKLSKCCFDPSYKFYREYSAYAGIGYKMEECKVKINDSTVPCETGIANVTGPVYRVKSSYFYIAPNGSRCLGRDAVISNDAVHSFVSRYLAAGELLNAKPFRIGLVFSANDQKGTWSNGNPEDFYTPHWQPGHPVRSAAVDGGCAAYARKPDSSVYLWELFNKTLCNATAVICELPIISKTQTPAAKKCGQRNERGVLAKSLYSVYDEQEASAHEWPWHAAVLRQQNRPGGIYYQFACSGVLINQKFVLTTAHCAASGYYTFSLVVSLGDHNLHPSARKMLDPVMVPVREVILHRGFDGRIAYKDDLALLELESVIEINRYPHIGLACLPSTEELYRHHGRWDCYSVGWPSQHHGREVLYRVDVEFSSEAACKQAYPELYSYGYGYPTSSLPQKHYSRLDVLCVKNVGKSRCIDDSSAVLVCKKRTTYIRDPFYPEDRQYEKLGKSYNEKIGNYHSPHYYGDGAGHNVIYPYETYDNDHDTWYVIGIANGLSECTGRDHGYLPSRRHGIQAYTAIDKYAGFINFYVNINA